MPFSCEDWVTITEQERINLICMGIFKHFKWFYEYQKRGLWSSFSNESKMKDSSQHKDDMAVATQDTSIICIDSDKLEKVLKKFELDEQRNRAYFI